MDTKSIKIVVVIGFLAIAGVLGLQSYWLYQTFENEQDRLDESIHIALLEVVKQLYRDQPLPQNNPVKRISADYYAVNTEAEIDASLLEYFLEVELARRAVNLDFEYAIYNCYDNEMVYGSYVSVSGEEPRESEYFPKLDDYVYYFAVRFPGRTKFVVSSLSEWILLTVLLIVVLAIYVYSVFAFSRQHRYASMQRDFINAMAHEFKTPLSSIRLASAYLIEQPEVINDDRNLKYAKALISSSDRLNSEVERILELARVEARSLPLKMESVSFTSLCEEVLDGLRLSYQKVQFDVVGKAGKVVADPIHLKNILFNLIDNAAKYGNGEVRIQCEVRRDGTVIRVEDNGTGIPVAERKRVFGKFYRSSTREEAKGFGLGLYYVSHAVKAHGWKIEVADSDLGGTAIHIIIPKS